VVIEFSHVFPQELPGVPPYRDVQFTIDLMPRNSPIEQPPCKMGPKKLVKLKEQVDELVNKVFVRESISPWGAPVVFVSKRDEGRRMCGD
jgi:hypothetical protein